MEKMECGFNRGIDVVGFCPQINFEIEVSSIFTAERLDMRSNQPPEDESEDARPYYL